MRVNTGMLMPPITTLLNIKEKALSNHKDVLSLESLLTRIRIRCYCLYKESGLAGADIGYKLGLKYMPEVDSSPQMLLI